MKKKELRAIAQAAAKKVIYLTIQDASNRWTMPIRNWKLALNRFMIEFEDRLVDYV
jgi:putative transposase